MLPPGKGRETDGVLKIGAPTGGQLQLGKKVMKTQDGVNSQGGGGGGGGGKRF